MTLVSLNWKKDSRKGIMRRHCRRYTPYWNLEALEQAITYLNSPDCRCSVSLYESLSTGHTRVTCELKKADVLILQWYPIGSTYRSEQKFDLPEDIGALVMFVEAYKFGVQCGRREFQGRINNLLRDSCKD